MYTWNPVWNISTKFAIFVLFFLKHNFSSFFLTHSHLLRFLTCKLKFIIKIPLYIAEMCFCGHCAHFHQNWVSESIALKKLYGQTKHNFGLQYFFSVKYMFWPFKQNYCGHQRLVLAECNLFNGMAYFFHNFPKVANMCRKVPKIVFSCIFHP